MSEPNYQAREREYEGCEREMESILACAQALTASSRSTTAEDSWKWTMGDTIGQMQALVNRTQESVLQPAVHTTLEAKEAAWKCRDQYKDFLPDAKRQKHERGTLVDYAAVARLFPAGNRVRAELTFSHARALSRVKAPEARAALTEQAIRSGWSVARLQAEINTAGRSPVDDIGTEDGTAQEWAKTQNSTWVCAQTGNPITKRAAMVELHIQPESMLDAAMNQRPKRGAAAKKKSNGADLDLRRVLRFESASALLIWLGASLDPANLEAAVPAVRTGPPKKTAGQTMEKPICQGLKKPASRVILSPILQNSLMQNSLTQKPPVNDISAANAATEERNGDHPDEKGRK